jgi:FtsZ-binding cell division protein ZapB
MSPKLREAIGLVFSSIENLDVKLTNAVGTIKRLEGRPESEIVDELKRAKDSAQQRWIGLRKQLEAAIEEEGNTRAA